MASLTRRGLRKEGLAADEDAPAHQPGECGEERTADIVDADVETFAARDILYALTQVFT